MAYIGKQPAVAALTASDITDGIVSTAKIADDGITEAKMANDAISLAELKAGTDGEVISWDASGNPVAVGVGTDGQVLTSTGAGSPPAFEDAGGGDMVKISTSSLSSASSWSTDSLSSTYYAYRIIANITSISTQYALVNARLRASDSDLTGANYTWSMDGAFRYTSNSGNGTLTDGTAGDTEWHPHGTGGLDTDTGEGVDMVIDLINPSDTVGYKGGMCYSRFLYDSARWYTTLSSFKYASQSAYTGIKLYTTAGTMSGTINLYGIK